MVENLPPGYTYKRYVKETYKVSKAQMAAVRERQQALPGREIHFTDYAMPPVMHDDYKLTDDKMPIHLWAMRRIEKGLAVEIVRCWKRIEQLEAELAALRPTDADSPA